MHAYSIQQKLKVRLKRKKKRFVIVEETQKPLDTATEDDDGKCFPEWKFDSRKSIAHLKESTLKRTKKVLLESL